MSMIKNVLVTTSMASSALLLTNCSQQTEKNNEQETKRPNIIIILADDMGYSDLGAFGSEINTPHLDSLAMNGLRMTQFYNTSRSCPSRASLLTGLYQHEAGVGFMTPDFEDPAYRGFLNDSSVTIAEVLKDAGYATYMSGKWHVGNKTENWPTERGFDRFYGIPAGGGVYFTPFRKDRDLVYNDSILQPGKDFYSTDNFNNYAEKFVREHKDSTNPFFMYVAHIAPHFPLQAHPEDIEKYRGKYREGFEEIRKRRFERMKKMGILPEDQKLSEPDKRVLDWDSLTEAEKDTFDLRMAVYAAQVECMDRGIGNIIDAVKDIGAFDNTLIVFLSDNGGTHEDLGNRDNSANVEIGSRDSWTSYRASWANVSNTPFRMYKHWVHEGGIAAPFIAHYPKMIKEKRISNEMAHINDFMLTCCELANTAYPDTFNGVPIQPTVGESLVPIFKGNHQEVNQDRYLFWEHMGNKAARKGDFKLVMKNETKEWELYNVKKDRAEEINLIDENTAKANELKEAYQQWAEEVGVLNWDSLYKANR